MKERSANPPKQLSEYVGCGRAENMPQGGAKHFRFLKVFTKLNSFPLSSSSSFTIGKLGACCRRSDSGCITKAWSESRAYKSLSLTNSVGGRNSDTWSSGASRGTRNARPATDSTLSEQCGRGREFVSSRILAFGLFNSLKRSI